MMRKHWLVILIILLIFSIPACGPNTGQVSIPSSPTVGIAADTDPNAPAASSQNNYWVRTYAEDYTSMGGDVIQATDGGFLIVGSIGGDQTSEIQGGVLLIKTDPNGEVLWQRVYGGGEYDAGWTILETTDGNYLLAGETASFGEGGLDGYLIMVDQDGNEVWSQTYGTPLNESITSIAPTTDGGYYLVGNCVDPTDIIADPGAAGYSGFGGRSNIYVVKIDPYGNEVWSRVVDSDDNVIASSGLATSDGGLVILATIMYFPDVNNDLYLLKVDGEGNEIWSHIWEEETIAGYAMMLTSDNCLIITGTYESLENRISDVFLLKVDLQGNEVWRITCGDPILYDVGGSVIETLNSNYLVLTNSAYSLYSGGSEVNLLFFDLNGNYLRTEQVSTRYSIKAQAILLLEDGGYVVTGSIINTSLNTYQVMLIKTDADGHVQEESR